MLAVAPMMAPAIAMAAGVVLDRLTGGCGTTVWALIAVVGAVLAVFEAWGRRSSLIGLVVAFVGIGGGWHHHRWFRLPGDDLARGVASVAEHRPAWLRGVVVETPIFRPDTERRGGQGTTRTVVAVTGVSNGREWSIASGRVATWIGGDRTDLHPGSPVELAGSLGPIEGPLNPGERDARDSWRAEGVRLRLSTGSPSGVWADPSGTVWPWTDRLGRLRDWSHRRLVATLDPSIAPLASALLLGRREGVDPDLNDAFALTGTTHLLAISGLHLQALAASLWLFCRVAGVGSRRSWWAVIVASTAYAILVGLAPSVVRSLAMTLVACIAGLLARRPRYANLMAIALLITLGLNPAHLFDVGCQLSFLAVGAILWGVPPVMARLRPEPDPLDRLERLYEPAWKKTLRKMAWWVIEGAIVSVVVWLAAWPLVACRFHLTSPVSILLNLPLVPATSLAMIAAGLSLGLGTLWMPLGAPAALACRWLLQWTEVMVRWGARPGWGHWFGPGPGERWGVAFYAILGLATVASLNGWRPAIRRGAWRALAICLAIMVVLPWFPGVPGRPEVEVLAVGHGLAVVVRSGDGRTLLYDSGRMGDPHVGRRLIAPALWERRVTRLDAVILSHADSDHYNGLPDLLERFSIGEVLIPPGFVGETNPGTVGLIEGVIAQGIPVRTIAEGERWTLGDDLALSVIHPPRSAPSDTSDNARSIVLDVESAGRRILLTGDLEGPGLAQLTARRSSPIDVFLAPHHGGRASNPTWLYDWAQPSLVVSSQRKPMPGTRDALDSVESESLPVWRTWIRGAIRLRWTPTGLSADGFLGSPDHPSQSSLSPMDRPRIMASSVASLPGSPILIALAGLILGLVAVAILAVVEFGAWILVTPRRSLALPENDPYPGEPIHINAADGTRLAGTWHGHPDADGRTLLLLHGLAEHRQTMRARADGIYARGWNVAVFDARAYGDSGGHLASFGGREVADLRRWIDSIADRVGPGLRLALWGRSMGAGVALRTAAQDDRIKALVLEAPYIDLHQTAVTLIRRYRIPASKTFATLVLRRARRIAGVSLHQPRPIDAAASVSIPSLILRGTHDGLVSDAETAQLAATLRGPVERIEITGARHSKVLEVGGPDLITRVGNFLDQSNASVFIPL
jgi:competence protein ComEC